MVLAPVPVRLDELAHVATRVSCSKLAPILCGIKRGAVRRTAVIARLLGDEGFLPPEVRHVVR